MTVISQNQFDVQEMVQRYEALVQEPLNQQNLDVWVSRWSDLEKQVRETVNDAYFRKVQNVRDEDTEKFYAFLLEEVAPKAKAYSSKLAERFLEVNPEQPRYQQMLKNFRTEKQVRTPELIQLQAEIDPLAATYDEITGKMMAVVDGVEMPGEEAWTLVFDQNRDTREKGWRAYYEMWKAHRTELGELLLTLVQKRRHMAKVGGFSDYRAYCWAELNRTDYTPADTQKLQQGILQQVTPLAKAVRQKQAERLGLQSLRPWDLNVEEGESLKPFQTTQQLLDLTANALREVSADWFRVFDGYRTRRPDLIDIETRADKGTGGFCEFLYQQGYPHIFMSLMGRHDDLTGFFHETGHALHFLLTDRKQDLYWHNNVPMEFNETMAMTMELLPLEHLAKIGVYSEGQLQTAVQASLEQSVQLLPRLVVYDAFQHWLYTEAPEDLTIDMLDEKWLGLWQAYIPDVDHSGLEDFIALGWSRVVHLYLYPFYMIEYVMAQVYAWQVWSAYLQEPEATVQKLTEGMELGATVSLPELIRTIGQSFPVDEGQLSDAIANVREKIFG
ncbi:M3 family metallopeptidase [Deinococcus cellulosilyticus]|uniref:Oligoendopeptidase F n=1 Tax=Deinococcus cellulosilyticus (strain DSM 18568 / NBRC 106333 / KACC 11606 / 5516J-15) TaxID=1223518 RepID=A0A511MXQ4_DEIC1|nr:M3 family metallopeptidase [Deinococcus cellulosilyticus]GEM45382.1 oligoendopeptidase F [Deinococcus cellulosilyticus NBRC 106333 = KACC 11606]